MTLVALRDALGALLPDGPDTNLLRSCLWPGEAGRSAWQAFVRDAGDLRELFRADHGSRKRLGPFLAAALRDNGATADSALLTVLRTAHLREELRAGIYTEILADVLETLRSSGVPAVTLTGAAFGMTLYAAPALRHSHDIDVLVREEDIPRAAEALAARGLRRTGPAQLMHRRALPVHLHARLLPVDDPRMRFDPVLLGSRRVTIAGQEAWIPAPGESLYQVLGLAAINSSWRTLQWACDASLLIRHMSPGDWELLRARISGSGLALWGWLRLEFLADALGADVPHAVRGALADAAMRATALERDRALYAARAASGDGGFDQVRRGSSVPARARLLRWLLLPSPSYMRADAASGGGVLSVMYVRRVLKYLTARFRQPAGIG